MKRRSARRSPKRDGVILLALVVAVPATAMAGGVGEKAAQAPFTVKSSLDGTTLLPHRIPWKAFPSLPSSKIARVEFLVDGGRPRWVERNGPYQYASVGWFVTSWLAPGKHRFQVRATAKDGSVATDTVVARVAPAPAPPATLSGSWQRTVDTTDAPKVGSKGNPTGTYTPSGIYRLTFEKRWMHDQFPGKFVYPASNKTGTGFVFLSDYTATPTLLHVRGEVIFHPLSDKLAEGGWWCYEAGPAADYRWTVSGTTLTLTPVGGRDACGIRGFIWAGDWTRVG
jgi:hypothetical protein